MSENPETIRAAVKAVARKLCPEYPGIDNAPPHVCLYALEQTIEGERMALQDWSDYVDILKEALRSAQRFVNEMRTPQDVREFANLLMRWTFVDLEIKGALDPAVFQRIANVRRANTKEPAGQ